MQAGRVLADIATRMTEVGLTLHPDKTRIVYCQHGTRRGAAEHTSFTSLGFTFRARKARNSKTGRYFTRFLPAASREARTVAGARLRKMRIHMRQHLDLNDLARWLNPSPRLPDRSSSLSEHLKWYHILVPL